jgi:hypothetical protein
VGYNKCPHKNPPRYKNSWCKLCAKEAYKKPKRSLEQNRKRNLKYKYGITEVPNQPCAICNVRVELLNVDHNHETGEVRGFLCNRCNIGLGHFSDNPALVYRALEYLCGD